MNWSRTSSRFLTVTRHPSHAGLGSAVTHARQRAAAVLARRVLAAGVVALALVSVRADQRRAEHQQRRDQDPHLQQRTGPSGQNLNYESQSELIV